MMLHDTHQECMLITCYYNDFDNEFYTLAPHDKLAQHVCESTIGNGVPNLFESLLVNGQTKCLANLHINSPHC